MCNCNVGPGKFEGEGAVAYMAWEQLMLGNTDASTGGESNETNWFRAPLNFDADQSVVRDALEYGYCNECIEGHADDIAGGVSLYEDGQGFVYCKTYATREEFDAALALAEQEDEQSADEDEDDATAAAR